VSEKKISTGMPLRPSASFFFLGTPKGTTSNESPTERGRENRRKEKKEEKWVGWKEDWEESKRSQTLKVEHNRIRWEGGKVFL